MLGTGTYGQLSREGEAENEPLVVGVIADTHIPTRAERLPLEVFRVFENATHIVHAGDFVEPAVKGQLESIAPVTGVRGNMDTSEIREQYPELNSLQVKGWKIGVVHDGIPLLRRFRLERLAKRKGFHVLIFAHTHRSSIRKEEGVLYINPGSPPATALGCHCGRAQCHQGEAGSQGSPPGGIPL